MSIAWPGPLNPDEGDYVRKCRQNERDEERRRDVLDELEWRRLEERLEQNMGNVMAGNLKWEDDDDDTAKTALDTGLDSDH